MKHLALGQDMRLIIRLNCYPELFNVDKVKRGDFCEIMFNMITKNTIKF